MEPLDPRRLLSGYAVVDVSWVPGQGLTPGKITNGGLFTLGSPATGYVTALSRHKAYPVPEGFSFDSINASGLLVGSSPASSKTQFDLNGTVNDLPDARGVSDVIGPGSSAADNVLLLPSVSDSGRAVGSIECHRPSQTRSDWFAVVATYDPATRQLTAISAIGEVALGTRAVINDAGVVAYGAETADGSPSVYDPATDRVTVIPGTDPFTTVTGINNHDQVIGTNFVYDAPTQALLKFGSSRTAKSFTPAAINDAGVIVGTLKFRVKVRNHFAWVQHGAVFADGKLTDLNTLVHAHEIITGASSVNDAGQILASTARGAAVGVSVLSPS